MQKQNVIIFFTDDQRFNTIHALGNEEIKTPNLDKLVENGTTFTHAHIPGGTVDAVCMPSRAMLHTGRTLFHLERDGATVPKTHRLMGETFQAEGYSSFGTGKWHNGKDSYTRSFTHGDDIFFGGMNDHWNVPAYHYDPAGKYASVLPQVVDFFQSKEVRYRQADHVTAGKHSSELFADASISFLEDRAKNKPFFMCVSFMAPHDPRTMPEKFLKMYDPEKIKLPPNFTGAHPFDTGALRIRDELLEDFPRDPEKIKVHIAEYYAMITHLDYEMGRVLQKLREIGEADNTIIVFAGDNGLAVGQHGLMGKQNLYEHSIRVPLIFSGPGIKPDQQNDSLVYLLDIYPTLCDLIGADIPQSVEGNSLIGLVNPDFISEPFPPRSGKNPYQQKTVGTFKGYDYVYLSYGETIRGVRDKGYKLIEYALKGKRYTQLFDTVEDPWELCNLAGQDEYRTIQLELRDQLFRLRDAWDDKKHPKGKVFWENYG